MKIFQHFKKNNEKWKLITIFIARAQLFRFKIAAILMNEIIAI